MIYWFCLCDVWFSLYLTLCIWSYLQHPFHTSVCLSVCLSISLSLSLYSHLPLPILSPSYSLYPHPYIPLLPRRNLHYSSVVHNLCFNYKLAMSNNFSLMPLMLVYHERIGLTVSRPSIVIQSYYQDPGGGYHKMTPTLMHQTLQLICP